jgi:hypothetical protein
MLHWELTPAYISYSGMLGRPQRNLCTVGLYNGSCTANIIVKDRDGLQDGFTESD